MPSTSIVVSSAIKRTPRVQQVEGLFEVPPNKRSEVSIEADLPWEDKEWNVGMIVGPSGSGKSTIARKLFGDDLIEGYDDWPKQGSVVDGFPKDLPVKQIIGSMSSVGFSSPPAWLRPYRVLSTGEKFRVTLARAILEPREIVAIDEFTSVVDRTVAQIGSAAVAKAVRRAGRRLVAVSCHYDIEEWLQPDWVYNAEERKFYWREVQRRPAIDLTVRRVHPSSWELFRKHHYLDTSINKGARCFAGFIGDRPVAFVAVLYFPHRQSEGYRLHRAVCLPDYQGVGIGTRLADYVSGVLRARGRNVRVTSSHPAMTAHRARSKNWRMTRAPSVQLGNHNRNTIAGKDMQRSSSTGRAIASFEYVGPVHTMDADGFDLPHPKKKGPKVMIAWRKKSKARK